MPRCYTIKKINAQHQSIQQYCTNNKNVKKIHNKINKVRLNNDNNVDDLVDSRKRNNNNFSENDSKIKPKRLNDVRSNKNDNNKTGAIVNNKSRRKSVYAMAGLGRKQCRKLQNQHLQQQMPPVSKPRVSRTSKSPYNSIIKTTKSHHHHHQQHQQRQSQLNKNDPVGPVSPTEATVVPIYYSSTHETKTGMVLIVFPKLVFLFVC